MRYADKTFQQYAVNLDGNEFDHCIFIRCQMIYAGGGTVSFIGCRFNECDWVVDHAAERTLHFLSAIYRELGPQGHELVEGIFDQIRNGTIGQPSIVPAAV
jgi:hypothetical protein